MLLEDFSKQDNLEIFDDTIEYNYEKTKKSKKNEEQNIDFTVDKNNNLVISLNLTKNIIKNIKKNSIVKLEFQLSKEFYMSIMDDFK